MSPLAQALLAELTPDDLAELAARLAPYLPATEQAQPDRWLTTKQAAEHLGLTTNALHRMTAARTVPFEQDAPGGKCWFKRSDLDAWRCGRR
jgi:excisionase family DNA binding protein